MTNSKDIIEAAKKHARSVMNEQQYSEVLDRCIGKYYFPDKQTIEVTFQVTEACTLACKYCYQYEKTPARMTWEVAKKGVDRLFEDYKDTHYTVILDFIGGEPFLEPELIMKIVDYWEYQLIMHMDEVPWYLYYMYSICSNGTDYFKPEVQKLLDRLGNKLSFTVSIDGNKELHDSARVHHDGVTGSYDEAVAAVNDAENNRYGRDLGSKMTIAPSNLMFLVPALKHYMNSGREIIYANTVYEEG